jgi:hypothetical protein
MPKKKTHLSDEERAKATPVRLLTESERKTWLTGSVDAALALQRPAANDALRIVATGQKQDG